MASLSVGMACGDSIDNENVQCTLEMFREYEEVKSIIDTLESVCSDKSSREAVYEKFVHIFDRYQEQPHLLDAHLDNFLGSILSKARVLDTPEDSLMHFAFQLLYVITKVRGYKVIVRHLPHEVADLELVLSLIAKQNSTNQETWTTRYMLLLWLSIVVMIPFHMTRLDSVVDRSGNQKKPVMERILDVIKLYLGVGDKPRDAAAFLTARFVTRPDVKDIYLPQLLDWAMKVLSSNTSETMESLNLVAGVLTILALIFKHGKREDVKVFASPILNHVIECKFSNSSSTVVRKMALKTIQRVGLSFLPIKVASWRYNRGSRSLAANLTSSAANVLQTNADEGCSETDDECEVPEEIEDIVEQLLSGLHDKDTVVRWSAAKGLGRVTERLPQELADEVVSSLLDLFNLREGSSAWHGGCLALAELGRRGLILPHRLEKVVPVVLDALIYDEQRGNFSVGANIRDSACYVCWAFARAYDPHVLKPFVTDIARALVITAVFDREINCRRAASAAFQENVGRQATFPHGIDIVTAADYFSVGSRTNTFLNLSVYIAQFPEYTYPLIDHLVKYKTNHWDTPIRELSSRALHNLSSKASKYMSENMLSSLIPLATGIDLNTRHGSILAIAETLHAVAKLTKGEGKDIQVVLGNTTLEGIKSIVPTLVERKLFCGLGGELMKSASCKLIEKVSMSCLPFHDDWELIGTWQNIINSCLQYTEPAVRLQAAAALMPFCEEYYSNAEKYYCSIVEEYLAQLDSTQEEVRCGYALAFGSMPRFMVQGRLKEIIAKLITCATMTAKEASWVDSRRDAIKALSSVCQTVGIDSFTCSESFIAVVDIQSIFDCFLAAMNDYTLDSRGDVGAIVREAAMTAFQDITHLIIKSEPSLITPDLIAQIMCSVLQQNVEQIDRTRAVAGNTFYWFLYSSPQVPHIPHYEDLVKVFPREVCEGINWAAAADTFPLFVKLLHLRTYTYNLLLGLTASVGGLSESVVKHSRESLLCYLNGIKTDTKTLSYICNMLLKVLKDNVTSDRIVPRFYKMADHLLTSGIFEFADSSEESAFPLALLELCWKALAKSGDPKKLIAAVDVFCGLLQYPGACRKRALTLLSIFLCYRYPRVRKVTANKLYEALISYSGVIEEENLDSVINTLSETEWDASVDLLRPVRNNLCALFGIPPPKIISKSKE